MGVLRLLQERTPDAAPSAASGPGQRGTGSRWPPDATGRRRDAATWLALVGAGLALTAGAVHLHLRVGLPAAPFTGRYALHLSAVTLLAPAVAVVVLLAERSGLSARLGWRPLLLAAYAAALAWAVSLAVVRGGAGLAGPLDRPGGYLADLRGIHPESFVRHFVRAGPHLAGETRRHPPAPVLLLWALGRAGIHRPLVLGLLLTAAAAAVAPLVAVSVRSLCGEPAARSLLPVLVLAPFAVWTAGSMDGLTAALAAAAIALGVVASEPRRHPARAAAAGLLLGLAALFGYAVAWLGITLLATYFVRRRPLLNLVSGVAALVPLAVGRLWGFTWPAGLALARHDLAGATRTQRSWLLWVALDLLLLLVACGPAVVSAARRVRLTPGWPFVVGAALAVLFALASGLSRGAVERSWLPFYPWLLVPAVAPLAAGTARGTNAAEATPPEPAQPAVPLWLVALGAVTAVAVEAVLRSNA